jgi:hypothetical protein
MSDILFFLIHVCILPTGTVVVQPEAVEEKSVRFKGPEFKSSNKKPGSGGGGAGMQIDFFLIALKND